VSRGLVVVGLLPVVWVGVYFAIGSLLSEAGPALLDADAEVGCGRLLVELDDGPVFHAASTRVALALDEEWRERFGEDATQEARLLLVEASGLFRSVDIHLLPIRVEDWESSDRYTTAAGLLREVKESIELGDADIVVALTAQDLHGQDGRATVGGRYAVIEQHVGHPERDAFVLAHEVAHLFGATHGCDLEGREGLLASKGFEEPGLICPCTRSLLEANAARFHEEVAAVEVSSP
jgi:hypothetical protein